MTINIISESVLSPKQFGGIHTVMLCHKQLLQEKHVSVLVNALLSTTITHIHTFGPFALFKLMTSPHTIVSSHLLPESFIGSYKGAGVLQGVIRKYLRFFYNHADIILALTKETKKDLRALGVKTNIAVLSNPVNTKTFTKKSTLRMQGRKKFGISSKEFVILGVGNVIPRKGIDEFIAVAHKFPQDTFIWAGGKLFANMLRSQSREYTKLLKIIPSNVRFLGYVPHEDMPLLYNAADVFLLASKQEIAPMVVLEAAACGLPLVLRDLPEYRELYHKQYIACATFEDFISAIERLQKDKAFYKRQSNASLALSNQFSYEVIGDQLLALYKSFAQIE